jgi:alcohol dehydrogenase class IV
MVAGAEVVGKGSDLRKGPAGPMTPVEKHSKRRAAVDLWLQPGMDVSWPLKIHAGRKALESLPHELENLGVRAPLMASETREQAQRLLSAFRGWNSVLTIADSVDPEGDKETVAGLAAQYRDHRCDGWIAVGSGRLIDRVRCANLLIAGGLDTPDALFEFESDKPDLLFPPLAIVPDLQLRGIETSRFLRLQQFRLDSTGLIPAVAVVDERIATRTRTREMLSAVLLALASAVEGFVSCCGNPFVQAHAAAAIRLIAQHLMGCVRRPETVSDRMAVVSACVLSGSVISSQGAGSMARLSETLTRDTGLAPGIAAGVLLPHFVSLLALKEEPEVGNLLEHLGGIDKHAATAKHLRGAVAANLLFALHYDLHHAAGDVVPLSFQETGMKRDELQTLAKASSLWDTDREACRTVLEHAWSGHPIVAV